MKKYGLIFDMDGTLWDSAEEVAASWTKALLQCGYDGVTVTKDDMYRTMGKTMDVIAEMLFSFVEEEKRDALLQACCEVENEDLRRNGAKLYPDIISTLSRLKKTYHLYIVSNCQAGYIETFLSFYHLEDVFEDIECYGNNGKQKAENIRLLYERNQLDVAAYVGDTYGDYEATTAAGLPFIHAAYGFGEVDGVPSIASFAELPAVAKEVLGV